MVVISGGKEVSQMNILNLVIFILSLLAILTFIYWLLIRKTKKFKFLILVFPSILFIAFGITFIPQHIVNIDPSNVSKITIFNSNTGNETEIKSRNDIDYIINNLNEVTFRKGMPSFGYMGYSFKTTIYDQNERPMRKLKIQCEDMIVYNWHFYKSVDQEIDYEYLENLVN